MASFFVVCYIISLIFSVITLITGIFVAIKRAHTIRVLPRAIRLYLITCCFPCFFCTSICSIYIAIFYLLYNTQSHLSVDIFRQIVTFCSQSIRNSFTFAVIERIFATVKLENYTSADDLALFWKLTLFSCSTSLLYVGYNTYSKSMPDKLFLYNSTNYYVYTAHLFMISVCAILYLLNQRIYKLSAYRITLKRRYTIAQNIKSLTYLFPSILIYSVCAQFGSMISIIFQALNLPIPPTGIFHIFFNLSYFLIYVWHYFDNPEKNATTENAIKNPLGKNIPVNVTADSYFNNLQNQWKK